MFGIGILIVSALAIVLTSYFGPTAMRSQVRRKLRAGSSQLVDGEKVTVSGTVRETDAMVDAVLSARRGVFIHAVATLPEADIDGPVTMRTQRMVPFELDTDAGVVLVDGTEAELEIKPKAVAPRDLERERAFMVAHGRGPEAAPVATFRELVIVPGMRIAVHGVAQIETMTAAERGYRDPVPTRARLVGRAAYPLAIGTAPKR